MLDLALMSLATATVSLTLAKSHVGEPVREWLRNRSVMLWKLANCAYCISHWVALLLVYLLEPQYFQGYWLNLILLTCVVVAIASIIAGLMMRSLFMHEREVDMLRDEITDLNDYIEVLKENRQ